MSRNGTGTYTLPAGNPVVTGTTISSTWANTSLSDIATALTQSLAKDGQTVPTANIPLGGFKITGLGAPTTAGDALAYGSSLGAVTATTGTFSGNVQMASANGGQLAGLRNKIINGNMNIAQRGTSFAPLTANLYSLDRWIYGASNDAVVTVTQQADVPSSNEFQNSYRLAVTTNDAAIAAAQNATVGQRIEGYNVRDLIGKTFTLSFWVRSSKTGIHCIAFRNGAADRSYVLEYTVSVANTWEYKNVSVSGGLIIAGTWSWTNGSGLLVDWTLACGSSFQTTAGAWQTGNYLGTSSQVNCLDTIGNIFSITGVQLEIGPVATPFEQIPYGLSLQLCQRYYQRNPIATGAFGTTPSSYLDGRVYNPSTVSASVALTRYFPVVMRINPTVTFYYDIQDGSTIGPSSPVSSNQGMFFFNASVGTGQWMDLDDWQAVAEL